jgi:hypothetical protein
MNAGLNSKLQEVVARACRHMNVGRHKMNSVCGQKNTPFIK